MEREAPTVKKKRMEAPSKSPVSVHNALEERDYFTAPLMVRKLYIHSCEISH